MVVKVWVKIDDLKKILLVLDEKDSKDRCELINLRNLLKRYMISKYGRYK